MIPVRLGLGAMVVIGALVACNDNNNLSTVPSNVTLPVPTGLVYQLNIGEQVGSDSIIYPGVLLSWIPGNDPDTLVNDFAVYGSQDTSNTANSTLRAITTSPSFHDAGTPQNFYFVTSQDVAGDQSGASNVVKINAADTVRTPAGVVGTALDSAVELAWQPNSITGPNGNRFDFYRVYSDDVSGGQCVANAFVLEGQSVSNAFVITGIANNVPRCYWTSAVTLSGHESAFSNVVVLTPSASQPPFSAEHIAANATVIVHHPVVLHKAHAIVRVMPH